MPRKGFFPPRREVVLKIILFLPSKADTGYATKKVFIYKVIFNK